jgi:hypothetical protein
MLSSQITVLLTRALEESHGEPPVPAWVVGASALGILLLLLIALVAFGGGREHS